MGCPRSTTARSSTRSATRCERNRRGSASRGRRRRPGRPSPSRSTWARSPTRARTPTRSCATGRTWAWSRSSTAWAAPAARSTRPRTGRAPAPTWRRGSPATSSSVGCCDLLEPDWNLNGAGGRARTCSRSVQQALQERLAELKAPTSGLRSRLLRALPTTMARDRPAAHRSRAGRPGPATCSGPATPARTCSSPSGARQLTTDDLRDPGDAMANLRRRLGGQQRDVGRHRLPRQLPPGRAAGAVPAGLRHRRLLRLPAHPDALRAPGARGTHETPAASRRGRGACRREISAVTGDDAAMAVMGVGADLASSRRCSGRVWPSSRNSSSRPRRARSRQPGRAGARGGPATPARRDGSSCGPLQADYEHYLQPQPPTRG